MSIRIYYEKEGLRLKDSGRIIRAIKSQIEQEKRILGNVNIIITGDKEIKQINNEFLKHNYYTDVITFNYNEGICIEGEIYISLDTVLLNAQEYCVYVQEELKRVVIHGFLHLLDMDDGTDEERNAMHEAENKWLLRINS